MLKHKRAGDNEGNQLLYEEGGMYGKSYEAYNLTTQLKHISEGRVEKVM